MTRRFQMRTAWRTILWILAIGCLFGVGPMHSELGIATYATAGSADAEAEASAAPRLTDLVDDLQSLGFYSRQVHVHTIVEEWEAEPIGQLFRDVESIESIRLRDEIQEVAARRLAMIEPLTAMSLVSSLPSSRRDRLVAIAYQEWSVLDIDEAVEYAGELDLAVRAAAVEGILNSRFDLPDHALREIASYLGHERLALDAGAISKLELPVDNPQKELSTFLAIHGDNVALLSDAQFQLLSHICNTWLERDEEEALREIHSTLSDDTSRILVYSFLLDSIASDNPQRAFDAASGIADVLPSVGGRLMDNVVMQWVRMDAAATLAALDSISNLAVRARAERVALSAWAKHDPRNLLSQLDQIPALLRDFGQLEALRILARSSPEEAVAMIADMENELSKQRVAFAIAGNWAALDPRAAWRWVQTSAEVQDFDKDVQLRMQTWTLREMVRQGNLQIAQEISQEQPDPALRGAVIGEVAHSLGAAEAVGMLQDVRDQEVRRAAYARVGAALVIEGQSTEAIQLVEGESLEYQEVYFRSLAPYWIDSDPQDAFDKLDLIPSEEARTDLAVSIALTNSGHRSLTSEQKKALKEIIPRTFHAPLN